MKNCIVVMLLTCPSGIVAIVMMYDVETSLTVQFSAIKDIAVIV